MHITKQPKPTKNWQSEMKSTSTSSSSMTTSPIVIKPNMPTMPHFFNNHTTVKNNLFNSPINHQSGLNQSHIQPSNQPQYSFKTHHNQPPIQPLNSFTLPLPTPPPPPPPTNRIIYHPFPNLPRIQFSIPHISVKNEQANVNNNKSSRSVILKPLKPLDFNTMSVAAAPLQPSKTIQPLMSKRQFSEIDRSDQQQQENDDSTKKARNYKSNDLRFKLESIESENSSNFRQRQGSEPSKAKKIQYQNWNKT